MLYVALGLLGVTAIGLIGVGIIFFIFGKEPTSAASALEVTATPIPAEASTTPPPTTTLAPPTATRTRAPTISASAACQPLAEAYFTQIKPLGAEFTDALQVAASTPRISLAMPIADLQRIRREMGEITPPPCAATAINRLLGGMDSVIDGFISFLADGESPSVTRKLDQDLLDMENGLKELNALASGLPTPAPGKLPTATPLPTPFPTATAFPAGNSIIVADVSGTQWQVRVQRVEIRESFSWDGKVEKAAGKFAVLYIEVTNRSLSTELFGSFSSLVLMDAYGYPAEPAGRAELYAQFEHENYPDVCGFINPDQTAPCMTVFDVPQGGVYYLTGNRLSNDPDTPRVEILIP